MQRISRNSPSLRAMRAGLISAYLLLLCLLTAGLHPDGNCHLINANNSCDPDTTECPDVGPLLSIDPNTGGFLLDGAPYFPVGFWGFYSAPPCGLQFDCQSPPCTQINGNWSCQWEAYCGGNYDWSVLSGFNAFVKGPDNSFDEGRASHGLFQFVQTSRNCQIVADWYAQPGVAAWEIVHEPNLPNMDCDAAHFAALAEAIRGRDPCHRPVFTTPSGGGITDGPNNDLADYAPFIDFAALQAGYTVPHFRASRCGSTTRRGCELLNPEGQTLVKPGLSIIRISGYQPCRFLHTYREPTYEELRVQAFDAAINGARAIMFYPFDAGVNGDPWGRGPAVYNVEDSPQQIESLRRIAEEITSLESTFTSPTSQRLDVKIRDRCDDADQPCIDCAAWDVESASGARTNIVCANLADERSPYFSYRIGGSSRPLGYIQSQLKLDPDDPNETPLMLPSSLPEDPNWDCEDDDDPLACKVLTDSTVIIQDIYTGEEAGRNQDTYYLTSFRFRVAVLGDPCGTPDRNRKLSATLYVDDLRDDSPHTPVMNWKLRVASDGEYTVPLQTSIPIEPVRRYFLVFRAQCGTVSLFTYLGNVGAQATDRVHPPPGGIYPPLIMGRAMSSVQLNLKTTSEEALYGYCVRRAWGDPGVFVPFDGEAPEILDDFAVYAVHHYDLYGADFDDCNADGQPDDCGSVCQDYEDIRLRCLSADRVAVTVTLTDASRSGQCLTVNLNGVLYEATIDGDHATIEAPDGAGPFNQAYLACPKDCALSRSLRSCSDPAPEDF